MLVEPEKQTAKYLPRIVNDILNEYFDARDQYPNYHSAHEGYAVILEELDELWDSIKANKPDRQEAIQVAATALRFVLDIFDSKEPDFAIDDDET
jgi:hypothetical protein